jgi:hypothetical protein
MTLDSSLCDGTLTMAFPKLHALQHLVDDIKECGSLFNFSADSNETSHKESKDPFKKTSKRKCTGQDEALERVVRAQGAIDASTAAMEMYSIPVRDHVIAKLMGSAPHLSASPNPSNSLRRKTTHACRVEVKD